MAMVLIEKSNGIKGYFSIKQNNSNKSIDYYIEVINPINTKPFDIIYLNNNEGYVIKNIQTKVSLKEKKIYQGSINNLILNTNNSDESIQNEGICIINKEKEILFGEYFNKKPFKIESINFDNIYKHPLSFKENNKGLVKEGYISKDKLNIKTKDNKILKRCILNIKSKNSNKEFYLNRNKNKETYNELIEINSFVDNLSSKATTIKNVKIYSKNDLTMKISYFIFKNSLDKNNKYYLITDSLVNIFKSNIKNYGHFLLSIVFKKNKEIKYIQIGIPDKSSSLNLYTLDSLKYKQIENSDCGYWFFKYEF